MVASTYDPQGIVDDAFAMANMTEGADAKVMTAAERNAIAALGTASTREADQNLRTTDAVEFDTVTVDTVNLHAASFDTTNGGPTTLGEMAWDSVDGTLDIMADGGVKIAVGEDGMIRVRNTSGATIPKGAPLVYAGTTGASGKLEVSPWIGANVTNVRTFLGFAAGEMANNTDGYAVWFGKIKEIDTDGGAESWNDGDIIYAIPGASATLSNVAPTSGDYVTAAVVINAGSGTSGSVFVRPTFDSISSISGVSYGDLDDAGTVDLPTINGPLATALGLKADASSLATVATSGSYADLTGTPSLATVATSGAYSDLTGTPTIPSGTQVEDYLVDDGIHTITSASGVATPDAANGRTQKFQLTENISDFNPPSNLADGQSMLVQVLQDSTPRTFTLDAAWKIMGAGTASDIGSLTAGQYAWLSISRYGTDYLIAITTEA
jgi:hypothetical protein